MIRVSRLLPAFLLSAAVACSGSSSPSSPTVSVPFSATDLIVGTGATATAGSRATVTYGGWLYSTTGTNNKGSQFDSGSFAFTVGAGSVIAGFDRGVNGMKVGGTRRIVIPPDLGYGNVAQGSIPANSTLVFDVALTAVQ